MQNNQDQSRGPSAEQPEASGYAADLAARIYARYGSSPGVIPMGAGPGLAGQLYHFADRLPLLQSVQQRWSIDRGLPAPANPLWLRALAPQQEAKRPAMVARIVAPASAQPAAGHGEPVLASDATKATDLSNPQRVALAHVSSLEEIASAGVSRRSADVAPTAGTDRGGNAPFAAGPDAAPYLPRAHDDTLHLPPADVARKAGAASSTAAATATPVTSSAGRATHPDMVRRTADGAASPVGIAGSDSGARPDRIPSSSDPSELIARGESVPRATAALSPGKSGFNASSTHLRRRADGNASAKGQAPGTNPGGSPGKTLDAVAAADARSSLQVSQSALPAPSQPAPQTVKVQMGPPIFKRPGKGTAATVNRREMPAADKTQPGAAVTLPTGARLKAQPVPTNAVSPATVQRSEAGADLSPSSNFAVHLARRMAPGEAAQTANAAGHGIARSNQASVHGNAGNAADAAVEADAGSSREKSFTAISVGRGAEHIQTLVESEGSRVMAAPSDGTARTSVRAGASPAFSPQPVGAVHRHLSASTTLEANAADISSTSRQAIAIETADRGWKLPGSDTPTTKAESASSTMKAAKPQADSVSEHVSAMPDANAPWHSVAGAHSIHAYAISGALQRDTDRSFTHAKPAAADVAISSAAGGSILAPSMSETSAEGSSSVSTYSYPSQHTARIALQQHSSITPAPSESRTANPANAAVVHHDSAAISPVTPSTVFAKKIQPHGPPSPAFVATDREHTLPKAEAPASVHAALPTSVRGLGLMRSPGSPQPAQAGQQLVSPRAAATNPVFRRASQPPGPPTSMNAPLAASQHRVQPKILEITHRASRPTDGLSNHNLLHGATAARPGSGLQRSPLSPSANSSPTPPPATPSLPSAGSRAPQAMPTKELTQLANRVYDLLVRRLALEKQRKGA